MRLRWTLAAAAIAGCIHPASNECADGTYCAQDTTCRVVHDDLGAPSDVCTTADAIAACAGIADDQLCGDAAVCHDGVCLPVACGDHRRDAMFEACDDGNTVDGDGCSADCSSDETCGNHHLDLVKGELCDDGNQVSHDGCNSRCRPETLEWVRSQDEPAVGAPADRSTAAIAYDLHRRRAVLFGGLDTDPQTGAPLDDTWEWDGLAWSRLHPLRSPLPRTAAKMVFDRRRDRAVMYGGFVDKVAVTETWEWDGTSWTSHPTPIAPGPRTNFGLAYDPVRRLVILFGGNGRGVAPVQLRDTWAYDGMAWTKLLDEDATSPSGGEAVMEFDPVRGAIVALAHGGTETWTLDAAGWHQLAATLPPRTGAAMFFDTAAEAIVVYGGDTAAGVVDEAWQLRDDATWSQLTPARSAGRHEAPAVVGLPVSGGALLVGGSLPDEDPQIQDPEDANTTLVWGGGLWTFRDDTPPHAVPLATATDPLIARSVLVTQAFTWEPSGSGFGSPTASDEVSTSDPTMAWDVAHHVGVLLSCVISSTCETWTWNHLAWTRSAAATPPVANPVLAPDEARGDVVMVDDAGETWLWDGAGWLLQHPATSPPGRRDEMLAWDPIRREVVMFGGATSDNSGGFEDTWVWDGATWTQRSPQTHPESRTGASFVWDPALQSVVLFGGAGAIGTGGFLADTWAWDGTAWSLLVPVGAPTNRRQAAMTPLGDGSGLLLFGGVVGSGGVGAYAYDIFTLRANSGDPDEGCRDAIDGDGDGLAGCDDRDCWAECTPTCQPSIPRAQCDPAAPRCGDGVCNVALENCRLCPEDCECRPICGDGYCDPGEDQGTCPGDCL